MAGLTLLNCLIALSFGVAHADVTHFYSPEFGFFPQPQPHPHQHQHHYHQHQQLQLQQQYPFQVALQPPQPALPHLYAAPDKPQSPEYPQPVAPTSSSTPAPVAVPVSTTTEFTLPEIVENRSTKTRQQFIPLQNQYLPPEDRPNYESPKPPPQGDAGFPAHSGYFYPRPTAFTTSTTTQRPSPIVVMDPPEFIGFPPAHQDDPQGYDYNAPAPVQPSTPAPAYLPPQASNDGIVVEKLDENSSLRLRVKEMRCLPHHGGFFRTVLKVDSFIGATPSVDNDSNDKRCEPKLAKSYVVVDIAEEDFHKCGVRMCGRDLCLRLRFPAIRGMRTGADSILTLHCKTQDRVAVKTHALKMGVSNDVQARNIGTYAHGGAQNPFRTHIELLRKSNNGYTRLLESNEAVQLGEDLLLRAHVVAGDGWNFTKLTDVSLQRISPSGDVLNTAHLITANGCLNPSMQSVCRQQPTFDPPLGHKLAFKAVMFQGMRSGEELVMSMRITGCLEHGDCHVNTHDCALGGAPVRRKRNAVLDATGKTGSNDTEVSEISRISFRVILPENEQSDSGAGESKQSPDSAMYETPRALVLCGALGFVVLLISLGIFAILKLRG